MSSLGGDHNVTEPLENNDYRLRRLFDGYVFQIPEFQRFYSWSRQHWDDLWSDLLNIVDEESRDHYMGTVICKDEGGGIETEEYTANYREYGIVDGQQRFTTLVLLVEAIVSSHEAIDEGKLSDAARRRYEKIPVDDCRELFVQDPTMEPTNAGYEVRNKLKLQQEDNRVFKQILREDVVGGDITTPSQARLVKAYEFYEQRLERLRETQSDVEFLHRIGRLLSGILGLQFMVYTVDDQAQATLIFESINDRGKGLSNLDKTKSFLMHKVYLARSGSDPDELTIDDVQLRFGSVYRALQMIATESRTSGISEDRIQRYHYIATIDRTVNSTYINEETNRHNRTLASGANVYLGALKWYFTRLHEGAEDGAYSWIDRDCIEEIDQYTAGLKRYYAHVETLGTYQNNPSDTEINWELRKLFLLGRLGNFFPLLLALWDEYEADRLTRDELHEILQLIEVASFRIYSIADRRSDTGQTRFYRLANKVATGGVDAAWIVSKLEGHIESLEYDFAESLRTPNAYKRFRYKDIRYLFYSYDLYLRKKGMGGAEASVEKAVGNADNDYTIEHIWPQNPSKLGLTEDELQLHDELKHSLGNLTLAVSERGSSWSNRPYTEKRQREARPDYVGSDFSMTKKIAQTYDTWGPEQIEARLDDLVEYAERRWSLDADVRAEYASIKPSEVE